MGYSYQIALSYASENQDIVETVYHYLKAEGLSVFYSSAPECQSVLSGKNQREIFYEVFGLKAEYVALFVSNNYVKRAVPMEEARIAIAKHSENGSVIPIYLDGTKLPQEIFDPLETNYFKSNNPAEIANHLATKIQTVNSIKSDIVKNSETGNIMNINNNTAKKQVFLGRFEGNINL